MAGRKERFGRRFFETTKAQVMTNSFTKLREISCRYSLPKGEYVLVPSTFYPRQESEFLLRIFSEKPHDTRWVSSVGDILELNEKDYQYLFHFFLSLVKQVFRSSYEFLMHLVFTISPFREIDVETKITLLPKVCRRNVFLIKFFKKGRK